VFAPGIHGRRLRRRHAIFIKYDFKVANWKGGVSVLSVLDRYSLPVFKRGRYNKVIAARVRIVERGGGEGREESWGLDKIVRYTGR
jgi:hypothetical protein